MKVIIDGKVSDLRAVWLENNTIKLIDQRLLPHTFEIFDAENYQDVAYAIRDMVVRGAPAIGVTAAYGIAQAVVQKQDLEEVARVLRATRPTGYDLFYAIDYVLKALRKTDASRGGVHEGGRENVHERLHEEALKISQAYADRIVGSCRAIGLHGAELIKDGYRILTHCNAGALATVDHGTALGPIRLARDQGKSVFVFVDETRPRLQGARLTSWELYNEGIEHRIIADNAAGYFMKKGEIDMVIVGADRIAANGDIANKIGTYEKAVVAHENDIPFYIAVPTSTIDLSLPDGAKIPIEERAEDEVLLINERRISVEGARARNPAFDITPAKYITGIITEKGIFEPHNICNIRRISEKLDRDYGD